MAPKSDAAKKTKRPTAIKRDTQNSKRRLQNKSFKSQVKTAMRSFEEALKDGNNSSIQDQLSKVYGFMDKGVKKGVFKLNKASRTKARISAKVARSAS